MKIDVRINEPIRQALTLNIDLGLVSEWQRKDTIKDILVDFFEENEILAIGEIEDKAVAEEKQQKQYKCNLHGVSNQRELLIAYTTYLRGEGIDLPLARDCVYVDEFLEGN